MNKCWVATEKELPKIQKKTKRIAKRKRGESRKRDKVYNHVSNV